MTLSSFALLALAVQSSGVVPSRPLERGAPYSELVAHATTDPLAVREAIGDALRGGELLFAQRLAAAHAEAWQDSFLVREVDRFAGWRRDERIAKLMADSLRRAGIVAYGQDGAPAAIEIWRDALKRSLRLGDTALAAAVTGNIATGFLRQNSLDSAAAYATRAVQLARAVGDRRVEANSLTVLGGVREDHSDPAGAREHYARALALHERIGDTRGLAAGRNNLGLLAWASGDLAEARLQFEAALRVNRREGRDEPAATNMINLAGVASLEGSFDEARRLYEGALATWQGRADWASAADALYGLGQMELRRGDYVGAQQRFREALKIYERTGPPMRALQVRRALAGALAGTGEMQGALDALRQAEDLVTNGTPVDGRAGLVLARADLAVQLNALAEAEGLYGRAEALYRQAGDPAGQAQAQHGKGLLRLARGDFEGAALTLDRAFRGQQAVGDRRSAAITRLALGQAARGRGDTALAHAHLTGAATDLEEVRDPVAVALVLGELAGLEMDRGLPASAERFYAQALTKIEGRRAPDVAWRLHAGLARAQYVRGAEADAAQSLHLAVAEAERTGRSLALPERRAGFLADKWDVFVELALVEWSRGQTGVAFDVSERLRAREMVELLGRGRIDVSTANAELVEREQDLRLNIAELTTRIEGAATGSLRGRAVIADGDVAREALLAAQASYSELLLEMRERAPRHAELVARETVGWRDVAARLRSDEALVEYLVGDSASVAFLVLPDSLAVVDLGIGRHDLARLVAFARGTVELPRPATDSLWRGPFRRLHRHLVEPLEDTELLAGITRLILVPHAELHYLPFAALLSDDGPLIRRFELATTPSATLWLALGERPAGRRPTGILAMAPRTDVLPGSEREVQAVARLGKDRVELLAGYQATEAAFRRSASGKRILHLATYGVLNQHNPLFSFVELSPGAGEDGRLEVHEVFGLQLDADLVVLSACQTGLASGRLSDVPPGDDWIGLTRAFLHAGARSVVATLWSVEDQSTARLMEEFYVEHEAGAEPSRALADAQRNLMARGDTSHPFYWAGVVVVEGQLR